MAKELPRVLVISAAVPETHLAGSLQLYRLLETYPAGSLLVLGPAPRRESLILDCGYKVLSQSVLAKLDTTRLAKMRRSMQAIGVGGRISLGRVEKLVGEFAPDVVVSLMEQADYVDVARRFSLVHRLPLVLVVHDRLESFELVYPGFRKAQVRRNAALYRAASARLCISSEMELSLRGVYGAQGVVLPPMRSCSITPRSASDSRLLRNGKELTIGYAGSLAYGYGDRLREAMPALRAANVRFRIYSRDRLGCTMDGVTEMGSMPKAEQTWERVAAECDVVWLPYSHAPNYRLLYETHFPSKLTEYLALGMPVLISGPSYATGVKWGLRNDGAALTVASESLSELLSAACRLRDSVSVRVGLCLQALEAAEAFQPEKIRSQFQRTLVEVNLG